MIFTTNAQILQFSWDTTCSHIQMSSHICTGNHKVLLCRSLCSDFKFRSTYGLIEHAWILHQRFNIHVNAQRRVTKGNLTNLLQLQCHDNISQGAASVSKASLQEYYSHYQDKTVMRSSFKTLSIHIRLQHNQQEMCNSSKKAAYSEPDNLIVSSSA